MARLKGTPKTGGRRIGTPNRTTEQLRLAVREMINVNFDSLQTDLKVLEPYQRIRVIIDLIKMILPAPLTPETLSETQLEDLTEYVKSSLSDEKD